MKTTVSIELPEDELKKIIKKIILECLSELNLTEQKKLFTSEESAKYLGIKVQTLYNYRSAKKIKPTKMVGVSPRYSKTYLDSIQI